MDETDPLTVLVDAARPDAPPTLGDLVLQINDLGYGTAEYFDCMAFLFITLARSQWRRADQVRADERRAARRPPRATGVRDPLDDLQPSRTDGRKVVRHGTCPACATRVRLRLDGTVKAHDVGRGAATFRRDDRCEGAGSQPLPPRPAGE